MIEPDEVRTRIVRALPGAQVTVKDLTGGKDHYEVRVVDAIFAGMSPLKRHRTVYALFADVIGGPLHALSLKTLAPGES